MNDKKIAKILLSIIMIVSLVGCGTHFYEHDIETTYVEWATELGLDSTRCVKTWCKQSNNELILGFFSQHEFEPNIIDKLKMYYDASYPEFTDGYTEMNNVINAHNHFVSENPDYFPEDIKIRIIDGYPDGRPWDACFFNNINLCSFGDYLLPLARPATSKIQFVCLDLRRSDFTDYGKELDIPVVILQNMNYSFKDAYRFTPDSSYLEFLKDFDNLEQVVIDFYNVDYDIDDICEKIHENVPGVEIYEVVRNAGGTECLRKKP